MIDLFIMNLKMIWSRFKKNEHRNQYKPISYTLIINVKDIKIYENFEKNLYR